MENQILFYKIVSWTIWPIIGIVAGLIISRFIKNLIDFQAHTKATIYGYFLGMILVGVFYLILSIFLPEYMGIDIHWGTVFLNFFIRVMFFYTASLITTWIMIHKKK